MIVVCVEAAVEVSTTTSTSSLSSGEPNTRAPSASSTSAEWALRNPGPAVAWPAVETSAKITSRISVESTAARPGAPAASSDSSLTVTQASQPQYTNTPSRTASTSAPGESANGSSQDRDGLTAPAGWPP